MKKTGLSASSLVAGGLLASAGLFFGLVPACSGATGSSDAGEQVGGQAGEGGAPGKGSSGDAGAGGQGGGDTGGCPDGLAGDGETCCKPDGKNLALASSGVVATAMSTYPGYDVLKVNDGSASTEQTETESWCNDWPNQTFPQWVELTFPEPRTFSRLELYTSDGYPVADYDLEYWDGTEWVTLAVIKDNGSVHRTHRFDVVTTEKFRVLTRRGFTQPTYHRINELELYCR